MMVPWRGSRTEEGQRYDSNSVRSSVRFWPGRHDNHVDKSVTQLFLEPNQMTHVPIVDHGREFCFHPNYSVATFDDEVDFVRSTVFAKVKDLRARRLGKCSKRQCHKRFEECSKERAISRDLNRSIASLQQVFLRSLQ